MLVTGCDVYEITMRVAMDRLFVGHKRIEFIGSIEHLDLLSPLAMALRTYFKWSRDDQLPRIGTLHDLANASGAIHNMLVLAESQEDLARANDFSEDIRRNVVNSLDEILVELQERYLVVVREFRILRREFLGQ